MPMPFVRPLVAISLTLLAFAACDGAAARAQAKPTAQAAAPACDHKGEAVACDHKAAAADDPAADPTIYRVDPGTSPARGPADAPVTLVLFSDFQCPFCKRVEPTIAALEKAYPGKLRVVWKNFPLPFHPAATPAARLAMVAHRSGKFWGVHDRLLEHQEALDPVSLERAGRALGLDGSAVRAAVAQDEGAAAVEADLALGRSLGVEGTPTVFINGRRIAGAYPLATFRAVVDQELARVGR
jgi:protein-disulfide isomerase